tara:strand:- start:49 stop:981 length:933 start_codon:yes stop_codon:yes gene_type:complete
MKFIISIITALFFLTSLNAKEIKMGKADWDTGFFQAEIYKKALEKMGYKVSGPTVMKPQVFYVAAAAGDMDLWVNGWFENHNTYVKEAMGKVKPVGYVVEKGGLQGYLIDKKTADKFNIKSIMDIKKHAKEFDINDDGKADMVACPPGWGCEKIITKHFTELGLGEFINPLKADYSASMADAISRYKNGKSILFYTWTPNWSVGTLKLGEDVVWIEAPFSDTKEVKVPNATKSKLNMGFAVNDIRAAANVDFLKANPKVEKMLKKASIPLADIAEQNLKMNAGEKSEKAIKKHAADWIKANQSTFDSWIN